ncbi:MAG: hypothetical protein II757_02565 [Bacteroidales bacterium]|jgi:antitoxin component YwqK of YwqJK toxin-antitoxin module|nr:hypothetical protein [Bacteroidales bacterium]MCR5115600.1 hypothetical protein [Bacteroidales bacterium]
MKKQIVLTCIVLLLFSAGCHREKKSDTPAVASSAERNSLQENHLLGKVKRVTNTKYMILPLEGGRDSLVFVATNVETYNEAGWLSGNCMTNSAGDTIYTTRITFDAKGHVVRSEQCDRDGNVKQHYLYQYDENGHRTQERYYQNDSLMREQNCENDANGNVERISVTEKGEHYFINYTNNPSGLPVLIEWVSPKSDEGTYMRSSIEYDAKGNVINRSMALNGRNVEYYHAQYNSDGHLLKEVYQRSLPGQLEEVTTEYSKHDSQGNWTSQESTRNGVRQYVIERKIEYYH